MARDIITGFVFVSPSAYVKVYFDALEWELAGGFDDTVKLNADESITEDNVARFLAKHWYSDEPIIERIFIAMYPEPRILVYFRTEEDAVQSLAFISAS